jgi:hypothetical protein
MLSKVKLLACKTEGTVGTYETLTAAEAVYNAFDANFATGAEVMARGGQGALGQLAAQIALKTGVVTFRTELYGDGAGGVPAWASVLLPAVGFTNDSGTFRLKSEMPGSNVKTLSMSTYEGPGLRRSIRGAVGDLSIVVMPGKFVDFNWTFTGAYAGTFDTAILEPTHPTTAPLRAASGTTTIGGVAACYSQMTVNLGNVIAPRPCITATDGLHSFAITDRNINGTLDPESRLIATAPVYTDWGSMTERALSMTIADGDDIVTMAAPKFQIINPQPGDRGGLLIDTLNFQCNRTANNDEFTIAFAAV